MEAIPGKASCPTGDGRESEETGLPGIRLRGARLPASGLGRQAPLALLPIAAGALAYFLAARALGVKELGEVASALRRGRRNGTVAR